MIMAAAILTLIVLLALGPTGGWSSGFLCMFQAGMLLAIPLGLRALLGDAGGWIGVCLLGVLALAAVAATIVQLVDWWRTKDASPAVIDDV
jgi:hypothetical protein